MRSSEAPLTCAECGDAVAVCSECQHTHDWYDHVGPHEHMCRWCLLSEYRDDPLGLPPGARAADEP